MTLKKMQIYKICLFNNPLSKYFFVIFLAKLPEAEEYTDCISAEI